MLSCFSCVWLLETLSTVAHQTPLSRGFSRQVYWSGFPCLPPGDLPDPGIKSASLMSPALAVRFFTTGKPRRVDLSCTFRDSLGEAFCFGLVCLDGETGQKHTTEGATVPVSALIRIWVSLSHQILIGITLLMKLPRLWLFHDKSNPQSERITAYLAGLPWAVWIIWIMGAKLFYSLETPRSQVLCHEFLICLVGSFTAQTAGEASGEPLDLRKMNGHHLRMQRWWEPGGRWPAALSFVILRAQRPLPELRDWFRKTDFQKP